MYNRIARRFSLVLAPLAIVTFQLGASGASLASPRGTPLGATAASLATPSSPASEREPEATVVVEEVVIVAPLPEKHPRAIRTAARTATIGRAVAIETPTGTAPAAVVAPPPSSTPTPSAPLSWKSLGGVDQGPAHAYFAFAPESEGPRPLHVAAGSTSKASAEADPLASFESLVRRGLAVDLMRQRPDEGPSTTVAAKANLFPITVNLVGRFP